MLVATYLLQAHFQCRNRTHVGPQFSGDVQFGTVETRFLDTLAHGFLISIQLSRVDVIETGVDSDPDDLVDILGAICGSRAFSEVFRDQAAG